MLNAHLHEQRNCLGECWYRLLGLLDGSNVFHPVLSKPHSLLDFTCRATGRSISNLEETAENIKVPDPGTTCTFLVRRPSEC